MFNFRSPVDPPSRLQWHYANEPELMAWTIRARNYNTFAANSMFAFMAAITLLASIIMYSVYEGMSQPWRTLSCVFFFTFILSIISCMTHQKMSFAFRLTKSGIEYCKWKDLSKFGLTSIKWVSVVTALIFLFLATIYPAFLVGALLGPGSMALMYFFVLNSKTIGSCTLNSIITRINGKKLLSQPLPQTERL